VAAARSTSARVLGAAAIAAALSGHAGAALAAPARHTAYRNVRVVAFDYRAHDGLLRRAFVVLPRWYGPDRHPLLPLVISPHGRGVGARANVRMWQDFPAIGHFAVVNPQGQGRRFALYSWGDPGEISDLLRMQGLIREAFPWIRIDSRRVYAIGGSMGGQETLLMVARRGSGLAGAAAFDAPTDLAARYFFLPRLTYGPWIQSLLRSEVGGTPQLEPHAYAVRSPLHWARAIAFSHVPLELWWSVRDQIVRDGAAQSGLLFRRIRALNPQAPVEEFVGRWRHSTEMGAKLPVALRAFGLWPPFMRRRLGPALHGRIVVTA
jgi:dipeptidyl aminopeptidase/acylaminoacyl peptidase